MLTQEELVYSQTKNREYIWTQARQEIMGLKQIAMSGLDECQVNERFKNLCKDANINPWGI